MSFELRSRSGAGLRHLARAALLGAAVVALPSAAGAQELVHQFVNPSFGGNPFYSDHLLAIANISRPKEPTTPTTALTDEQLIIQQLRSRLLSSLTSDLTSRILDAQPGDSGTFTLGDQQVSFERTTTETRVTFTNTKTGEVSNIVIPVNASGTSLTSFAATSATSLSAEQALGALGTSAAAGTSATAASNSKNAITSGEGSLLYTTPPL